MSATADLGTEPIRQAVAYVYAPDRKAERPIAHLDGFKGIREVDSYGGYRTLAEKCGVTLAFCWRTFAGPSMNWPRLAPRRSPTRVLRRLAEFYKIEDDICGMTLCRHRADFV